MSDTSPKVNSEEPASNSARATSEAMKSAIESAIAKLRTTEDPSEMERALNVIKLGSDIEKTNADKLKAEADAKKVALDASLAAKQMRHALLASMLAPLVPLTALATVIVTTLTNTEQMHITQAQATARLLEDKAGREEANWKAFETDLDKSSADSLYRSGTFVSRLRTFAATGKYEMQLLDITKHFMAELSSASAFQDIWKIAFKKATADNFDQVVELARVKKRQFDQAIAECQRVQRPADLPEDTLWTYLGMCSPKYSLDEDLRKAVTDISALKALIELRDKLTSINSVQLFLTAEISEYVRANSNKKIGPKPYDLSNVTLISANLEDVDFSQMELNQTTFFASNVAGSILKPKGGTLDFRTTPWWEAEAIDQSMLPWLLLRNYGEMFSSNYPVGYKITRDQYLEKIAKLCAPKTPHCEPKCLRFGTSPPTVAADCPQL